MALFTVINNANIHPIKMKGSIKENELFIPSYTKYIFKEVITVILCFPSYVQVFVLTLCTSSYMWRQPK